MSGNLYRVEFRKSEPQFIWAEDADAAATKASENVGSIVRPATMDEMLDWAHLEIELAKITLAEIQKEFGIDCE
jgi:hypothetical protein